VTKLQGIHWPNYPCENGWRGRLLLSEILGQTDRVGAKSLIFNLFSPVVPQPYDLAKKFN